MIDSIQQVMPTDLKQCFAEEAGLLLASMAGSEQRGGAIVTYARWRAAKEIAGVLANPRLVREGDVTEDAMFRLGVAHGLSLAAGVPEQATKHLREAREK